MMWTEDAKRILIDALRREVGVPIQEVHDLDRDRPRVSFSTRDPSSQTLSFMALALAECAPRRSEGISIAFTEDDGSLVARAGWPIRPRGGS
jgi:hypothetical protein